MTELRGPIAAAAALLWALLAISCTPGMPDDGQSSSRGMRGALASNEPRLEPYRSFDPGDARALTTPRWLPDGDALLVSGFQGRGLYLADLSRSRLYELNRFVHAGRRLVSSPDRRAFALVGESLDSFVELELADGRHQQLTVTFPTERPRYVPPAVRLSDGESDAEVLWRSRDERIVFEPLRGRVAIITSNGEEVITPEGAWAVAVSPDGRRVAFCLGHLIDAGLYLYERGRGTRELGPGVHPTWHPDGRHLVFAMPETDVSHGRSELVGSELFILDVSEGDARQLTWTSDETEMQPALSPRGDLLAYSDWRTGALSVARLTLGQDDGRRQP